jgi:hypothetical protein
VPWQLVLFLLGMMLVLRKWDTFAGLGILFVVLCGGLYWFWFRHLAESPSEASVEASEELGTTAPAAAAPLQDT